MTLERLGFPGANVLGTNYTVTSLTVSDYNPNIDSTVTLTVTVKDVYNRPVVGEEVTVTASEGNFTQYNGSTITGASSYTGTTNSSGQFTLTYNCSVWGLITFSTNTISTQIKVTGWKKVQNGTMLNSTGTFEVYANGEGIGYLYVQGSANIQGTGRETQMFIIQTPYTPIGFYVNQVNSKSHTQMIAIQNGAFTIYNTVNVGTVTVEYSTIFRY